MLLFREAKIKFEHLSMKNLKCNKIDISFGHQNTMKNLVDRHKCWLVNKDYR
jgi:hypothetical protein